MPIRLVLALPGSWIAYYLAWRALDSLHHGWKGTEALIVAWKRKCDHGHRAAIMAFH